MNSYFTPRWPSAHDKTRHHQRMTDQYAHLQEKLKSLGSLYHKAKRAIPEIQRANEPDAVVLMAISTATASKQLRDEMANRLIAQKRLLKFFHPDAALPKPGALRQANPVRTPHLDVISRQDGSTS